MKFTGLIILIIGIAMVVAGCEPIKKFFDKTNTKYNSIKNMTNCNEHKLEVAKHLSAFKIKSGPLAVEAPVLLYERPNTKIVDIVLTFKGRGDSFINANKNKTYVGGFMGFVTTILNLGDESRDKKKFRDELGAKGIKYSVDTDIDDMYIRIRSLEENLEKAFELVFAALASPNLSENNMTDVANKLRYYAQYLEQDPRHKADFSFQNLLFENTDYEPKKILPEDADKITIEDIKTFVKNEINTCDMEISVAGGVTAEKITNLLTESLGKITRECSPNIHPKDPIELNFFIDVKNIKDKIRNEQKTIHFAQKMPGPKDPFYLAIKILYEKIGGKGLHSDLMEELREKMRITYGAYAGANLNARASYIEGTIATGSDKTDEILAKTKEIFQSYVDGGFKEMDLEKGKTKMKGKLALSMSDNAKILGLVRMIQKFNLDMNYFDTMFSRIDDITLDDIKKSLDLYFDTEKMSFMIFE